MAATGCSQRISPLAMARPYAVHYASSGAWAFGWRFHTPCNCCVLLAHEGPNQLASRPQTRAVVRMTNPGDEMRKRFRSSPCYTALQTGFARVCSKNLSFPTPLSTAFCFSAFTHTLQVASQDITTPSYMFLADISDRKGDASLPMQYCLKYPCTTPTINIFAAVL